MVNTSQCECPSNSKRYALLTQRRKLRTSNQHKTFGSLGVTQTTKQNTNADFRPFDATQARQRLRPGSPKKNTGYQSRPRAQEPKTFPARNVKSLIR
jgi:hypothetical protein